MKWEIRNVNQIKFSGIERELDVFSKQQVIRRENGVNLDQFLYFRYEPYNELYFPPKQNIFRMSMNISQIT